MGMLNNPRQLDASLHSHQCDSRGGGGDQSLPSHAWSGLLIVDMFQDCFKEWITKAVTLAPGEAILFFWRWSHKEGLPYTSARDIGFSLTGPVNWLGEQHKWKWLQIWCRKALELLQMLSWRKRQKPGSWGNPKGQRELSSPHLAPVM